ncbi:hypothetical protein BJ742DRAFT_819349 [Cladochytrium replicatum]|nr:hypothetical protein BJ742DRAFT_819349 [Cladochytrium replicatum]
MVFIDCTYLNQILRSTTLPPQLSYNFSHRNDKEEGCRCRCHQPDRRSRPQEREAVLHRRLRNLRVRWSRLKGLRAHDRLRRVFCMVELNCHCPRRSQRRVRHTRRPQRLQVPHAGPGQDDLSALPRGTLEVERVRNGCVCVLGNRTWQDHTEIFIVRYPRWRERYGTHSIYKHHPLILFFKEREKQIMGWQEYFFKPMGAHLRKSKPMPFCWVDLPVKDTGRAKSFYETLFNWKFSPGILDNEPFFSTAYSRYAIGGCLTHKMKSPRMYIGVHNLEESLERAKANGGEVMGKIQPAGDYGRHCSIKDTEGNIVGLYCMGKMTEEDLED